MSEDKEKFDIERIAMKPLKRAGETVITSVSLTKDFRNFMDNYNISPTWAIRKGVAIEMFDRGLPDYNSDLNKRRYEALKQLEKETKMEILIEKLNTVVTLLKDLKEVLEFVI